MYWQPPQVERVFPKLLHLSPFPKAPCATTYRWLSRNWERTTASRQPTSPRRRVGSDGHLVDVMERKKDAYIPGSIENCASARPAKQSAQANTPGMVCR